MAGDKIELDCLVIGAGFGGLYQLHILRKAGFSTKLIDAASKIGGVWAWNCYPGARVDVEMPYYGYTAEEISLTWVWKERYPGREELLRYFDHVDKIWDLSKDIKLNTRVVSAELDESNEGPRWNVKAFDGSVYRAKFVVCGTGTSFKQHIPKFEGYEKFTGIIHHSSLWPEEGVDLTNKSVAIIGAGSTAVQVMQEAAKVSKKVTQFIRTPNIALPMRQRQVTREEIYAYRPALRYALKACRETSSGLPLVNIGTNTFDVSEEERLKFWEEMWELGGFNW
jgi:cation diffusion facilitator CzcD-associated flavoprotein CzcO